MSVRKRFGTVAIVGVGLIGGSIGLALRRRGLAREVVGIGRRSSSLRIARQRGAISSGTVHLHRGVANADLVVVCTPLGSIVDQVLGAAQSCPAHALITDAGSSKAAIVSEINGGLPNGTRYLGSHPLAGSELSGPRHAEADLLEGRGVIVTPTRRTSQQDRRTIKRFWSAMGAHVIEMGPAEHDRTVASVSHLPHLVAAAVAAATSTKDLKHVATGWLDTTRIAAGDEELWSDILLNNRDHVLNSIGRFEKLMSSLHQAIKEGNKRKLKSVLRNAKTRRDSVHQNGVMTR